ncbi:MAG: DUF1080 domain-containing protein [Melioribacteraceae bacterium]|nr:DUF1080 domain-containing protein [Melioribacteraceae bacterium]
MMKNGKKIIGIILTILIILLNVSCTKCDKNGEQEMSINNLSKEEVADGWQLLFDGESFDGWRGIGIDGVPTGHWKIDKGSIQKIASGNVPTREDGQPLKGGDLMTKKTFKNYELKFEWKISEAGNSGVKYNVIEEFSIKNGSANALGYEYQVLDDEKHIDNLNPTHRTGSLYDIIEAKETFLKPVGEYNTAKIVFNESLIEHWLNGKKVLEANTASPEFDSLYQKSKYHIYKDFTLHKDAHIVLQDHGNDCWYRNIKIKIIN